MESKSSPFQKTVPTLIPHHCRDALCLWKGSCYHLTRCADRSSLWLLQSNLKLPKRIGVQIKGETDNANPIWARDVALATISDQKAGVSSRDDGTLYGTIWDERYYGVEFTAVPDPSIAIDPAFQPRILPERLFLVCETVITPQYSDSSFAVSILLGA